MNLAATSQIDSTKLTPFGDEAEIATVIVYDTTDFVIIQDGLFCFTRPLVETTIFKIDLTTFYANKYRTTKQLWLEEKRQARFGHAKN